MASLGGQALSGIGYGLGTDRALLACGKEGLVVGETRSVDVFCVPIGAAAKALLVKLTGDLRAAGIRTDLAYGNKGLKGAMKGADRSGALVSVIVGERDLEAGVAQVKDMVSGEQNAVPLGDLSSTVVAEVSKLLKENHS